MRITIDGVETRAERVWFPAMSFGQFRWQGVVAGYEVELPRVRLIELLRDGYNVTREELRHDDALVPSEASPLRALDYPPIEELLEHGAAASEILRTYLTQELLGGLLPGSPAARAAFMINSVDRIEVESDSIRLVGRGYRLAPGDVSRRLQSRP